MLMLKREKLENMKVDEIKRILKDNGISYYKNGKRMNKKEMIERYIKEISKRDNEEEQKPFELLNETIKENEEKERIERKKKYVENAVIGDIIAVRLQTGKVISAAIIKKSTSGRKFLVETKYNEQHKISFDDVLWVRNAFSKRWPVGIYNLFKQNEIKKNKSLEL